MNRRAFLQVSLAAAAGPAAAASAAVVKPERDPFDGLKLGITSYTWRSFTLDQAIAMTRDAKVKYLSLKDVHLPLNSAPAALADARKKVEAAGLSLLGAGVIYFGSSEAQIRHVFEYAKAAGIPTIICSPDPAAMDTLERVTKDYDIRIAIHNHGPGDRHYPSPLDVLKMVKDRDARMGLCMDVGHTVRNGEDPVAVIRAIAPRLYDFHMKDVTRPTGSGAPTEVGRGVIDIVAVLKTLIEIKYPYHVALEYEAHGNAPVPGVIESLGYLRGALAAIA